MIKSNHYKERSTSFPAKDLSIIQKLITSYKLWHDFLSYFPKTSRYTLGEKIDLLFVEIIELSLIAINLYKDQKLSYIQKAIIKLDLLKFFLQIAWEIKVLDNKKFILLSERLHEIGKMLGGWCRQLREGNSLSNRKNEVNCGEPRTGNLHASRSRSNSSSDPA